MHSSRLLTGFQLRPCCSEPSSTSHLLSPAELSVYRHPVSATHRTLCTCTRHTEWGLGLGYIIPEDDWVFVQSRKLASCVSGVTLWTDKHNKDGECWQTDCDIRGSGWHAKEAGDPSPEAGQHALSLLQGALLQLSKHIHPDPEELPFVGGHHETVALEHQGSEEKAKRAVNIYIWVISKALAKYYYHTWWLI